jgi:hypothetical protein
MAELGSPEPKFAELGRDALAEGLADLLEGLVVARDHFDLGKPQAGVGEILALTAVLKFCQRLPDAQQNGSLRPLKAALRTILDVSTGHTPTWKPWRGGRAGGGPPSVWEMKIVAAVAMQRFMDAGQERTAAAERVANKLHSAGYRQHGTACKPIGGKTVAMWRDELVASDSDEYRKPWREEFQRLAQAFAALGKPTIGEVDAWTAEACADAAPEIRKQQTQKRT